MSLTDALKKPNATPVYLLEVTGGEVLKKWVSLVVPSAPADLVAVAVSTTAIDLDWTATSGATSYSVYRGTSAGVLTLLEANILTNEYSDTGLTAGTEYFYAVTATNAAGEGAQSTETSATTEIPVPANLAAANYGAGLRTTWDDASADSYKVYRSTTEGGVYTLVDTTTDLFYLDNTLTAASTAYWYKVSAVVGAAESDLSSAASATTYKFFDSFSRTVAAGSTLPGNADSGQTYTRRYFSSGTANARCEVGSGVLSRSDTSGDQVGYVVSTAAAFDLQAWFSKMGNNSGLVSRALATANSNVFSSVFVRSYIDAGSRKLIVIANGAVIYTSAALYASATSDDVMGIRLTASGNTFGLYYKRAMADAWAAVSTSISSSYNNTQTNHGAYMHANDTTANEAQYDWMVDAA